MKVCAVKSLIPEKEKDKSTASRCFQVINPTLKKPLIFQADSEEDCRSWESAILMGISNSLDNAQTKHQSGDTENPANESVVKIIRSVPGNLYCADCKEESM